MIGLSALKLVVDGHADPAERVRLDRPRAPSSEKLFVGLSPAEAAERAGLVFNVCGAAQRAVVAQALDCAPASGGSEAILAETLRDHAITIAATWPEAIGMPVDRVALSAVAQVAKGDGGPLQKALLGAEPLPKDFLAFETWLNTGSTTAARVLAFARDHLDDAWGRVETPLWPTEAPADAISSVDFASATWRGGPFETGLVARHAAHPLMRAIEAVRGRSILWRLTARVVDLAECFDVMAGRAPPRQALRLAPGIASAPAARGAMLVRGRLEDGRVAALSRLSPTDAILHPDGVLPRAITTLAAVPAERLPSVVRLLLAAMDPCLPNELVVATPARDTMEETSDVHRLRMLG